MIALYIYLAWATLLAYAGTASLYVPTLERAQDAGVFNRYTLMPRTGIVVCFLVMWVMAPLMTWILVVPNSWYRLAAAMRRDVLKPE